MQICAHLILQRFVMLAAQPALVAPFPSQDLAMTVTVSYSIVCLYSVPCSQTNLSWFPVLEFGEETACDFIVS